MHPGPINKRAQRIRRESMASDRNPLVRLKPRQQKSNWRPLKICVSIQVP